MKQAKKNQNIERRDADLFRYYVRLFKKSEPVSTIYKKTGRKFYIEPETAYRIIIDKKIAGIG